MAAFLFSNRQVWYAWMVPVAVQAPVALAWALLAREESRRAAPAILPVPAVPALRAPPSEAETVAALDSLHRSHLIHRDIKPSNIIFVNGVPKMADIGLVTDMQSKAEQTTYVGTEGYIAPEKPGTARGDVFNLGKVLCQIVSRAEDAVLRQLNQVILKACEKEPAERYQAAADLLAALQALKTQAQA